MSAATLDSPRAAQPHTHATGPKTQQGKSISVRNAVTHGLHAQDVVLPHLGESQAEFDALQSTLARELSPHTAVESHYVTQIAQAMWRLRRLTRWEASLYDDPALTDEDRITKMARVLRHDAALRRHIDRALKALSVAPQNCQNEPTPSVPTPPELGVGGRSLASPWQGEVASLGEPEGVLQAICQNEPAPVPTHPLPQGEVARLTEPEGSPPIRAGALRKAQKLKQQKKCQNEHTAVMVSHDCKRGSF